MKYVTYNELTDIQKLLLESATKAKENAYSPYSHFLVGAAILTKDSEIITGANVENSAYGPTICAERAALTHANAMGKRLIESIAVIARGADFDAKEPTAPCGICRQMIYEAGQVSDTDIELVLSNTKKDRIILTTISELLPLAFGPKDLGVDVSKYRK